MPSLTGLRERSSLPGLNKLHRAGRSGRLSLFFKKRDEKTILYDSFSTIPMQAFQPFYPDGTGCAYTYLVNPTGGLVAGDMIDIDVTLDENAHVFITSPSATRVYRSTGEVSSQSTEITVKRGAVLEYMPGYVIPYSGSRYRQRTEVCMDKGSTAFILDAFVTGRVATGESLEFGEYGNTTEIVYDGELILTERLLLKPEDCDYNSLGLLEGNSATAVIYLIFDDQDKEKLILSGLQSLIEEMKDVLGGVSTIPAKGVVVRLLGGSVRFIESAIYKIWSAARKHISGSEDPLSFRMLNAFSP
ncbi:urease accessory protein UreD [bacterium BMS3Bbin06]|nr:urease accessory protein UreD [bacterium BMS3Bbin06]HDO36893.1 urease accessory protein UreD [Nitrospirota bacterium]HDY72134.1 urease accessory protein UreD [Nitrospirota bacterium]